ncbi:MAG: hypothetical protein Q8L29_01730 [archaeon]|nr:hypothetical protein [archaeon]
MAEFGVRIYLRKTLGDYVHKRATGRYAKRILKKTHERYFVSQDGIYSIEEADAPNNVPIAVGFRNLQTGFKSPPFVFRRHLQDLEITTEEAERAGKEDAFYCNLMYFYRENKLNRLELTEKIIDGEIARELIINCPGGHQIKAKSRHTRGIAYSSKYKFTRPTKKSRTRRCAG